MAALKEVLFVRDLFMLSKMQMRRIDASRFRMVYPGLMIGGY